MDETKRLQELVDNRSDDLQDEFREYWQSIIKSNPEEPKAQERSIVFESWALQKIAGVQVLLEELNSKINKNSVPSDN